MWEAAALALLAGGAFLWIDSLRARELAVQAGRSACERYDLQFLDDTVSFARMRLARNEDGELRIARTYTFEFTETGNNRRQGAILMLGHEPDDVRLEPYELARR
ncbi:MAG TPA: DUF3301 domain-containing protein [Burkholderiales bacterium]|nr:DUF3301 domain-containing protein [Burkholderiales bacterium]